jgi:hypothetical protein
MCCSSNPFDSEFHGSIPFEPLHTPHDEEAPVISLSKLTWLFAHRDRIAIHLSNGQLVTASVEGIATHTRDAVALPDQDRQYPLVRDVHLCPDEPITARQASVNATLTAPMTFPSAEAARRTQPDSIKTVFRPVLHSRDGNSVRSEMRVDDLSIVAAGRPAVREPHASCLVGTVTDSTTDSTQSVVLLSSGRIAKFPGHGLPDTLTATAAETTLSLSEFRQQYDDGRYAPRNEPTLVFAEFL